MPPAPDESGDSSGVSILSLVIGVSSSPDTNSQSPPTAPLGRDGQPKRKPGRPRKIQVDTTHEGLPPSPPPTRKTPQENKASKIASETLASAILNTSIGAAVVFIGDEWQFTSQDEADGMRGALSTYIDAKGGGQVSPETMLLLCVAGFSLSRLQHQNTRSKLSNFLNGIFAKFERLISLKK